MKTINPWSTRSPREKRAALRGYYRPRRAALARTLVVLYLLAALIMVGYAVIFTWAGYHQVPFGEEVARATGNLPVILLDQGPAPSIDSMPRRQPLPFPPAQPEDRWLLRVVIADRYSIHTATTLETSPLVRILNPDGTPRTEDTSGHFQVDLASDTPYIVTVIAPESLPQPPAQDHYYNLLVYLPDQNPRPLGIIPETLMVLFLTLMGLVFTLMILAVLPSKQ